MVLYLQYIEDSLKSKAAAKEAVHALNWVHRLAGLESLTQSPLVQTTLEDLRRLLARPVQKRLVYLNGLGRRLLQTPHTLKCPPCLLAFLGFLRSDELISLWPCDIKLGADMTAVTFSL